MQTSDILFSLWYNHCTHRNRMCRYFLNLHPCLHFLFFYVHFSGVKVFVDGGRYMCLIGATNCLVVKLKSKFPNHVIMNN
jgi:hypothetical protein